MRPASGLGVAALALWCVAATPAHALEIVDIDEQLRIIAAGGTPEARISGAEFRMGAFPYEDPDGTGLGNALAALVGHEMLMNTNVRSLGVLVFAGGLSPGPGKRLSYYDKVDLVTAAQGVSISTWGVVRRQDDELIIDTYIQIPPESVEAHFTWERALPAAMGAGVLRSHLRPDRLLAQRLRVPASAADRFAAAAAMLRELREFPTVSSPIKGTVPQGEVFYVKGRAEDWVLLQTPDDDGWVPLRGHCTGPCTPLLDAASFAGGLVRFMADTEGQPVPEVTPALSTDALAVTEQLAALVGLRRFAASNMRQPIELAMRWAGPDRWTGPDERSRIQRGEGVPPGGAAFANLRSIAEIGAALAAAQRESRAPYDELALSNEVVLGVAEGLAEASLDDPRNAVVLHNLAVLFAAAGDDRRADLARGIAQKSAPRD